MRAYFLIDLFQNPTIAMQSPGTVESGRDLSAFKKAFCGRRPFTKISLRYPNHETPGHHHLLGYQR